MISSLKVSFTALDRFKLIPLVFFLTAALAVGLVFRYPLVTDDPFITYRYALNLIESNGFVYNVGERVLSTTTPLYAFVLAFLGLVYRDIPALGYWLSVLSYGVAAYLMYSMASSAKMRLGGILAGSLLLAAPALVMTFGLETGFYLMLALAAFYAYQHGRVSLAFAFAALLTLTRSDGALVAIILAVHYLWKMRAGLLDWRHAIRDARLLRPFLIYLILLAPWLIFSFIYFGSPFPFTLAAKLAQAQSGLWDPFAIGLGKWAQENVVWLAPLFLFAIVGMVAVVREKSLLLLVGAWAVLHLAAYSLLGVAFYAWYVAPLIPALVLIAGIGVECAVLWIGNAIRPSPVAPLPLGAGLQVRASFALALVIGIILLALELRADILAGMTKLSPKVQVYQQAAQWLALNTEPDASVDALEVGIIGYADARRTLDFVGLVDPQQLPYLRVNKLGDGIRRAAADYVVTIPPDAWLPRDVWFKDAYLPVHQIPFKGLYNNKPLVIYQRADVGHTASETMPLNAAFEKRIELESVDLFGRAAKRGASLPIRLNLRALNAEPVPDSWKFTLQLVGAENRVVAQTDNFYPARLPEDEKSFADYQAIPIGAKAAPGDYNLILAMYDVKNNERLSFYDANGNEAGDFLDLGKITILQ